MHDYKTTTKYGFIKAIENDEYAEYELPCGAILISDTEMDGTYFPYVHIDGVDGEIPNAEKERLKDEIWCDIESIFDIEMYDMEWSSENSVFYPVMNRPRL